MLLDYIRQVAAQKKLVIKNNFDFISFDDITLEVIEEDSETPNSIEIWGKLKLYYDGEIPHSYKILNLLIGDWVANNEKQIADIIHNKLIDHLEKNYSGSDSTDLKEEKSDSSAIWLDQLDYMPVIDEDEKSICIELDLALDIVSEE